MVEQRFGASWSFGHTTSQQRLRSLQIRPERAGLQSVSCLCPHSLQTNLTRVEPFSAESRFGAPHLPQTASIRVLPCLTTRVRFSMDSRIRRSASSRIVCFDICARLPPSFQVRAYSTRRAQVE